jgi:hypothetical protein
LPDPAWNPWNEKRRFSYIVASPKRRHAAALAELEQRWALLRAPVRNLTDADLTHATSVSYDCRLKGTIPNDPFWTSPVADQLWGDRADDAAWEGDALQRSISRQLQRIWLFELADEYLGKMRLTTDERGREDLAKALSFGIRKAQFLLERRHQGDFSPDAERPEPPRSGNAATANGVSRRESRSVHAR